MDLISHRTVWVRALAITIFGLGAVHGAERPAERIACEQCPVTLHGIVWASESNGEESRGCGVIGNAGGYNSILWHSHNWTDCGLANLTIHLLQSVWPKYDNIQYGDVEFERASRYWIWMHQSNQPACLWKLPTTKSHEKQNWFMGLISWFYPQALNDT